MRSNLRKREGKRSTFTGTFERMGTKEGYKGPIDTVLLTNIKNKNGEIVTDHLWFNYTKGFRNAKMETGDEIKFDARVKSYEKGYKGYRDDVSKPIETDLN